MRVNAFYPRYSFDKIGLNLEKGLGKDNQGMKTALKPVLKFDTRGVNFLVWKGEFRSLSQDDF